MNEDFTTDLEHCLKVLTEGGVILYPTDTVWGLGCDATNDHAVEKLLRLKGKKPKQGLILLLASERDVLQYVTQLDMSLFDHLAQTDRPTTVIYEGGTGVADSVLAQDGSIAIRIVKEDFCRHLVKRFRKPIVSTSANFHGRPAPAYFYEVENELKKSVDYIVQYRQNDTQLLSPSSIIKWRKDGSVEIIR
jgi:L-threonylcarbamoyladenylate synthase